MPNVELLKAAVLDTHAWVWMCAGDARAAAVEGFRGRAVVSAISVWEVAMLAERGRLTLAPTPDQWIEANLRFPVELEPLHPAISLASVRLENFHGDPADRLIVATAVVLRLPLMTADAKIVAWASAHPIVQVIAL
jgi:PIN domain nuclease of toxin-antitoxin system